jgi:hypothetical protein
VRVRARGKDRNKDSEMARREPSGRQKAKEGETHFRDRSSDTI